MLKWSFSLFFLLFSFAFGDDGYVIDKYNVDVMISKENIYSIEENISVNFLEPRRGIIRVIPTFFDGRDIPIDNVRATKPASLSTENFQSSIRIGDENTYLEGKKNYFIQFDQDMGWDGIDEYDEVYFNIIGNDWDTTINRVNFSITLPENFDSSKINFTMGERGSTNTSGVVWNVQDNTISGYTTKPLEAHESLTIALPLEEGYFNVEIPSVFERILWFVMGFPALILYPLILLFIFSFKMKNRDTSVVIETVEFYPPDNLTPSEIGYIIDSSIDSHDLTSMIYYWANKGYIKIKGIEENNIELIKTLNPIFEKSYERHLFKKLFSYSSNNSQGEEVVSIKSLNKKFAMHINDSTYILQQEVTSKLFDMESYNKSRNFMKRLFPLTILSVFVSFALSSTVAASFLSMFGGIAILITGTLLLKGNFKRTPYGTELLGRARGFKKFLTVTEKHKLETLLAENPNYFYDILPYAIVLGVSDIWADKFKDLTIEPPSWSDHRHGNFNSARFMSSLNKSTTSINNSLSSSPKTSNHGGGRSSSSGGSSGGGAGGGGGSSW